MNKGTAIKVSLVIIPKTLFGRTFKRIRGNKSTKYPIIATKIAVPDKVNATGYPAIKKKRPTRKKVKKKKTRV